MIERQIDDAGRRVTAMAVALDEKINKITVPINELRGQAGLTSDTVLDIQQKVDRLSSRMASIERLMVHLDGTLADLSRYLGVVDKANEVRRLTSRGELIAPGREKELVSVSVKTE